MDENLRNYIAVLSLLDFHYSPSTKSPGWAGDDNQDQRNKLVTKILDGLALLLVQRPQGDVAAVSFRRERDGPNGSPTLTFVGMSNEGISRSFEEHSKILVSLINQKAPADEILDVVIRYCSRKILRRCKEAFKALEIHSDQLEPRANWTYLQASNANHNAFTRRALRSGLFGGKDELQSKIDGAIKSLADESLPHAELARLVKFWHSLDEHTELEPAFPGTRHRRLKKIVAYYAACLRLSELKGKEEKHGVREIKFLALAPPPLQQQLSIKPLAIDCLNLRVKENRRLTEITEWDAVYQAYPKAGSKYMPGAKSSKQSASVTFSQHAEISVALALIGVMTTRKEQGTLRVGVSKACCLWCNQYFELLNSHLFAHGIRIVCRKAHNKRASGWLLPLYGPAPVNKAMEDYIRKSVDKVFEYVEQGGTYSPDSDEGERTSRSDIDSDHEEDQRPPRRIKSHSVCPL